MTGVPTPPEPSKPCAKCRQTLPLSAYDSPGRKNCKGCAAIEAARRTTPNVPKPEGWRAPKPGETPMKRCTLCRASKVWSAFPEGGDVCRVCVVGGPPEEPAPEPEATGTARKARPTEYTPALGAAIAERIAMGETLKAMTADASMPSGKMLARWRLEHEEFAEMLARAREARGDARADEIADLVEAVRSGAVDAHAGRVAIDGLRWLASKDAPRVFGDKVELSNPDGTLRGNVSAAAAIEALIAALPDLAGKADAAPQALLPSSTAAGDGADGAAGAQSVAPAASTVRSPTKTEVPGTSRPISTETLANEADLDLSDDPDGYATPARAA